MNGRPYTDEQVDARYKSVSLLFNIFINCIRVIDFNYEKSSSLLCLILVIITRFLSSL